MGKGGATGIDQLDRKAEHEWRLSLIDKPKSTYYSYRMKQASKRANDSDDSDDSDDVIQFLLQK